jgi:hypothetical protein
MSISLSSVYEFYTVEIPGLEKEENAIPEFGSHVKGDDEY